MGRLGYALYSYSTRIFYLPTYYHVLGETKRINRNQLYTLRTTMIIDTLLSMPEA